MLNDLAIGGLRPIDDNPSRQNNRRNSGQGKKFSLHHEGEEENMVSRETNDKLVQKRKEPSPVPEKQDGGIDIII
ncbi:MAG: hypothetical protein ABIK28_09380 [Planctomycetota bacterium]